MDSKSLQVDTDLCVGCFACVVACKQEHNLPVGVNWMRIVKEGPMKVDGKLTMRFNPIYCPNCKKPPCIDACPVGAISKRFDGIVLFDEELCTGCKECIEACPFEAIQYDPEKAVAQVCDLCVERVDKGLKPSCVLHCPTGALYISDTTIQ